MWQMTIKHNNHDHLTLIEWEKNDKDGVANTIMVLLQSSPWVVKLATAPMMKGVSLLHPRMKTFD